MYIVSLTYKVSLDEVDIHIKKHIAYLKTQYAAGNFIASGRKDPRTGGIILSKIENLDELRAVLQKDPFYQLQIADYEITEFIPSMVGTGFENLQSNL